MNVLIATEEPDFAGLVNRQSQFAFRVAWTMLRNAHDAEDVVQETFLKLYRNGSWSRIENERAFVARVVWRMSADRLRARRSEVVQEFESAVADPEQAAISADRSAAVHRMMDALPEDLRQPLALSTIDELNSRQIAEIMGVAEGTVRTRIMRARQLLKQKLWALRGEAHG